jgi:hypothetical protein
VKFCPLFGGETLEEGREGGKIWRGKGTARDAFGSAYGGREMGGHTLDKRGNRRQRDKRRRERGRREGKKKRGRKGKGGEEEERERRNRRGARKGIYLQ